MDNHMANQRGPKGALLTRLQIIDILSARPLRAVLTAQAANQPPNPTDLQTLIVLEDEASQLRSQLNT